MVIFQPDICWLHEIYAHTSKSMRKLYHQSVVTLKVVVVERQVLLEIKLCIRDDLLLYNSFVLYGSIDSLIRHAELQRFCHLNGDNSPLKIDSNIIPSVEVFNLEVKRFYFHLNVFFLFSFSLSSLFTFKHFKSRSFKLFTFLSIKN